MTCSPQHLYRDTRNAHKTLYLDGKNRAMVCSLRLVPGLYPDSTFLLTASILKPTQTPFIAGPLTGMLGA
jgi:hypothetical protein